ncbi:hypothetical protein [Methylobacterium tarhaniae]|uniref:hypothetical protein n=1 Tax=Methylobacterium tarhaniae TaxID=1187852 RepID=UPI003D057ED0
MKSPYKRARLRDGVVHRVVIEMPKEEVDAVDKWGVPAGMESRTAAVRALLRKGLEAASKQDATATN